MAKYKKFKKQPMLVANLLRLDRYNISRNIEPPSVMGYYQPITFQRSMHRLPPYIKIIIDNIELEFNGEFGSIDSEKLIAAARDNKTFELELKIK